MRAFVSQLFLASCVLFVAGCGSGKPSEVQRVKVSGTVTLDGKKLGTGKVLFDPQNGEPPNELDILDGKFEGYAAVGKNKVQISSYQKMSMKEKLRKEGQPVIDGPGYDELVEENILPERYNVRSEIQREVVAGQANEFSFELQKK